LVYFCLKRMFRHTEISSLIEKMINISGVALNI